MKQIIFSLLLILFSMIVISSVKASNVYYSENAVWIQDAGWPRLNKYSLNNLTKVVDDLTKNHIKYAIVMVGYYDGNSPTNAVLWQRTTTGGYMDGGPPNATFYTSVVNALHAANITAIAWIEDTHGPINISPSNWENLESQINLTLQWGFDGYSDDIESINGTHQDYINWVNNVTVWLHSFNKLSMPAIGYDWRMDTNPYLHVDYIVTMFYGPASLFDPSNWYSNEVEAYWQENFGMYGGKNNPPASPVILGIMNFYGNTYPLAWQLDRAGYLIKKYGAPQLKGFSIWLYEYMGTNPTDWRQWNYWITHTNETYSPTLRILNITTSPMVDVPMTFEGSNLYKLPFEPFYSPRLEYLFNGTVSITAPSQATQEIHHVLFGDPDHTGGSMGYNVYTYAGGPYNLTSSANVSSLYFYCKATGNVKVAIYNATSYHIDGWIGTDYHPYALLTQSSPTSCVENTWIVINVSNVTLKPGIYFIAIKGDTAGIIGGSGKKPEPVGGDIYGYDQFITESYSTDFKQIFPTVEGAMGNEPSVYVPTAPLILTQYSFAHWEDGSIDLARKISVDSNMTITAFYTTSQYWINITGMLKDKNNNPVKSEITVYLNGTNNVITSTQTSPLGYYSLQVPNGTYDIQFTLTNFFIPDYSIKLRSVNASKDLSNIIKSITQYPQENRVSILMETNYSKKILIHSDKKPLRVKINGAEIQTWSYNETSKMLSINLSVITAKSGYWKDIQEAVELVASMGGGNVYIPAGTWNFVNVNESWTGARVIIPAGVNLLGARTERTKGLPYDGIGQNPNDQVVEWKTILKLPWDVPGTWDNTPIMFLFVGNGNFDKPSRFSDIKLIGYRSFDPESTNVIIGIKTENVVDFRVDHVYFEDIAGGGVQVDYRTETRTVGIGRGIIDHCYFINTIGYVEPWYANCTVGYGVAVYRNTFADLWDPIEKVLGHYTNYSVYIEDSYFEKWRHCVASNSGAHYVFRHNTIKNDYGQSLDAHGWFQTRTYNPKDTSEYVNNPSVTWNETLQAWVDDVYGNVLGGEYFIITQLGTRAVEIYNNKMLDANWTENSRPNVIQLRGGSGVVFNNIAGGGTYKYLVSLTNEARKRHEGSKVWCNDIWVWNNTVLEGMTLLTKYDPDNQIIEGVNYHLEAPSWYTPYPYPHPLTQK